MQTIWFHQLITCQSTDALKSLTSIRIMKITAYRVYLRQGPYKGLHILTSHRTSFVPNPALMTTVSTCSKRLIGNMGVETEGSESAR